MGRPEQGEVVLGPFVLGDEIGAGGMSVVYKGHHAATGTPVAVKITRFDRDQDALRRAFTAEISAMAQLHHPAVVRIHDWGVLPDATGNWCAMDWSAHGSLDPRQIGDWTALEKLLVRLLDALAHAHARQIVHRDLKPDNVLVFGGRQDDYRLADFGLAYARTEQREDSRLLGVVAGTPQYMAPEQIEGRWREWGPWTDLYALACMAFEIADGRPPFAGTSALRVAMAHLYGDLAPFTPRFAVPAGLEPWLRRLLSRDWRHRPRAAGLAKHALLNLGPPVTEGVRAFDSADSPDLVPTLGLSRDRVELLPTEVFQTAVALGVPRGPQVADATEPPWPSCPFPSSWHTGGPTKQSFVDVGSSLFELRRTELVGNETARDELWAQTVRVVREGKARVVLVESADPRQVGLFCDWVEHTISELSDLVVIPIAHRQTSDTPTFATDLRALLGCEGLGRIPLREHLEQILPHWMDLDDAWLNHLLEVFDPAEPGSRSPGRWTEILYALIERAALRNPLVVVARGAESLDAVWWIAAHLQRLAHRPVLIVLGIAGGQAVNETPMRAAVRADPTTTITRLMPLDRQASAMMLDSMLRLDNDLREQAIDIAVNDATHVVELLRYGVTSRMLRPTADGHRLTESIPLPQSFEDLIALRLRYVRAALPGSARLLSAAALWGDNLSYARWTSLAETIGVDDAPRQMEVALRHRFINDVRGTIVFESERTRNAVAHRVDRRDVESLLRGQAAETFDDQMRVGRLLIALGQTETGASLIVESVYVGRTKTLGWLAQWLPAAKRAVEQLDPGHPLHGEVRVLELRLESPRLTSTDIARFDAFLRLPCVAASPRATLDLRLAKAMALGYRGQVQSALELLHDSALQCRRTGLAVLEARTIAFEAWLINASHGDTEGAKRLLDRSVRLLIDVDRHEDAAFHMLSRAQISVEAGEHLAALEIYDRALALHQSIETANIPVRLYLERSVAHVFAGHYAEALHDAELAYRYGSWVNRRLVGSYELSYALCLALNTRFDEALRVLDQARLLVASASAGPQRVGFAALGIAALSGDTETWDALAATTKPGGFISIYRELTIEAWRGRGDARRAEEATRLIQPMNYM